MIAVANSLTRSPADSMSGLSPPILGGEESASTHHPLRLYRANSRWTVADWVNFGGTNPGRHAAETALIGALAE